MSLKAKILASLKTKYKTIGLSDRVLSGIADMLAITTTEEENIETAVAGVEELVTGFQADADKRVNLAVTKAKAETGKTETTAGVTPETGKAEATTQPTDIAKIIEAAMAPFVQKLNAMESGNITKSRKQVLEEKLKDVNPKVKAKILKDFDRMKIDSDDDFNSYVEESIADAGELSKVVTEETLGAGGRPIVGNKPADGKQATKEELDAVMANL